MVSTHHGERADVAGAPPRRRAGSASTPGSETAPSATRDTSVVFSSVTFLFYFLPLFFALYYILPWRNVVLLFASLLFYAWGEPRYVPLLLTYILINWAFGLLIARPGLWAGRFLAAG